MATRRDTTISVGSIPPSNLSAENQGRSRRRRRGIGNSRRLEKEEPFSVTVFKVGATLLMVSCFCYATFLRNNFWAENSIYILLRQQEPPIVKYAPKKQTNDNDKAINQHQAQNDVFGVASQYHLDEFISVNGTADSSDVLPQFAAQAAQLRARFADAVGGVDNARDILRRGLFLFSQESRSYGPTELATHLQQRYLNQKKKPGSTFSIAVIGSSAAAGVGNFYNQSYPFATETILRGVFKSLNIEFKVQKLALEHIMEFPLVWCVDRYLTPTPDILVWDFGPKSHPERFEAFLRNVASHWNTREGRSPFLIFRDDVETDSSEHRNALIRTYVEHNAIVEPVLLHVDNAAAPYLDIVPEDLPPAFQSWRTSFAAPPNAPGREHAHLTVRKHEMVAWLLSMHVLSALELAVAGKMVPEHRGTFPPPKHPKKLAPHLPPPFVIPKQNRATWKFNDATQQEVLDRAPPAWLALLIGQPERQEVEFTSSDEKEDDDNTLYAFPTGLQCRTTYSNPLAQDDLDEIIVAGAVKPNLKLESGQDNSILLHELLLPKGAMFHTQGWVEDLDKATKRNKQLTKQWNFLGFQDMIKKAYFGMPSSDDLSLFVPLSASKSARAQADIQKIGTANTRDYIPLLVICSADVPRSLRETEPADGVCRLHEHAMVLVGGERTFLEQIDPDVSSSCVFVNVPDTARLFSKQEVIDKVSNKRKDGTGSLRLSGTAKDGDDTSRMGLSIDIRVRSDKGALKEPCSLAHVIWKEEL